MTEQHKTDRYTAHDYDAAWQVWDNLERRSCATGLTEPAALKEAARLNEADCQRRIQPKTGTIVMNIADAARILTQASYGGSKASGWHNDPRTGAPRTPEQNHEMFPVRLMLTVSELSEAMEGHRKSLMDDKLPHRTMAEVELADAAIRIFDLAGAMGYDLGGAIAEKLAFNAHRADHKVENRLKAGGKAY